MVSVSRCFVWNSAMCATDRTREMRGYPRLTLTLTLD